MPAKGATMAQTTVTRRKIYVEGSRPDVRVPFAEVALEPPNEPVRLYDTSGPGADPGVGLPPLRRPWVLARGDVEDVEGRQVSPRDNGRAAGRAGTATAPAQARVLRATPGR